MRGRDHPAPDRYLPRPGKRQPPPSGTFAMGYWDAATRSQPGQVDDPLRRSSLERHPWRNGDSSTHCHRIQEETGKPEGHPEPMLLPERSPWPEPMKGKRCWPQKWQPPAGIHDGSRSTATSLSRTYTITHSIYRFVRPSCQSGALSAPGPDGQNVQPDIISGFFSQIRIGNRQLCVHFRIHN